MGWVVAISFLQFLAFCLMTRGITFIGLNTDNQKQVYAASQIHLWGWPSGMHRFAQEKSRMKDVVVILLALMQRILGDTKTDYPLVVVCALGNCISSILIYVIAAHYWGTLVAALLYVLYISSFWPWQIALMGGHICVGQMLFLLSVVCMQMALQDFTTILWGWLVAAGACFGLTQFASASSRKFIPLFAAVFFYPQLSYISWPIKMTAIPVGTGVLWFLGLGLLFVVYKKKPALLKWIKTLTVLYLVSTVYVFACIEIFGQQSFWQMQMPTILGCILVWLMLLLPDIPVHIKGYFSYFNISKNMCHFVLYQEYFASIGKPIPENMRGVGWIWIIRYLLLVEPLYVYFFIMSIFVLITSQWSYGVILMSVVVSLSPLLWAELTRAPQLGRSFFPTLHGQLFLIGTALSILLVPKAWPLSWESLAVLCLVGNLAWNIFIFTNDVYPARMVPAWLYRMLQRRGIKEIYTYNTHFNDALVGTMNLTVAEPVKVHYIHCLKDILSNTKQAAIVIPCTSSKALHMEAYPEGFKNEDFRNDSSLNSLLDTKEIMKCAVAKLKTFGTSRIWQQESEVPTYRDLILHEVTRQDHWRGFAWLLEATYLESIS